MANEHKDKLDLLGMDLEELLELGLGNNAFLGLMHFLRIRTGCIIHTLS